MNIQNALIGIGSMLATGGLGWLSSTVVSNSAAIGTIQAVQEVQVKNSDERYHRIEKSLDELKNSQLQLNEKMDKVLRRGP